MRRALDPLITLAGLIGLWALVVWLTAPPPYLLPGPGRVAQAAAAHPNLLAKNALVTAAESLAGLGLGVAIGSLIALLLVSSAIARRWLLPVVAASQAAPVFALAPLLTYWLGFGLAPKIVVIVLMIFLPVAAAFYDGLRRTDPGLLDLARTMNAAPGATLWRLRVPAAMPAFGSGLKLAAIYAPIGAVLGEWVGGSEGLGYVIKYASARSKVDLAFAAMILLMAMAIALYWAAGRIARRLSGWAPESEG